MKRLLPHPGLSAMLALLWVIMVNDVTVGTIALGLGAAVFVPLFTAPWWPGRPKIRLAPALGYLGVVAWDIVIANFQVAGIILFKPAAMLRPAWLTVPLNLRTPEAITVLAGTISLTPGTVAVDLSACGRFLLVHALHAPDPAAETTKVKARYEARLERIFA